jgi:hypothetical protein
MNKREALYAAFLEGFRLSGDIAAWKFEPFRLKLAPSTFFNIDFEVVLNTGLIELHEVKGHWEDDARVKIKVAATMFPEFKFLAVTWNRSEGWKFEEFRP